MNTIKMREVPQERTQPEHNFPGLVWMYDREGGVPTIKIDPATGDFFLGGQGVRGRLSIQRADDTPMFIIDANTCTVEALDREGNVTARLNTETGDLLLAGSVHENCDL